MWTPVDFLDLGPRAAVDKALQRLAAQETITRIDRGLLGEVRFGAKEHRLVVRKADAFGLTALEAWTWHDDATAEEMWAYAHHRQIKRTDGPRPPLSSAYFR